MYMYFFCNKIPTNVVLVRGRYHNLTVSIYGNFANLQLDPSSQVPPPPPQHEISRPMMHIDNQMGAPGLFIFSL